MQMLLVGKEATCTTLSNLNSFIKKMHNETYSFFDNHYKKIIYK